MSSSLAQGLFGARVAPARVAPALACAALLTWSSAAAQAQQPQLSASAPQGAGWSLEGSELELRLWMSSEDVPELDRAEDSPATALHQRARGALVLNRGGLQLVAESDVLTGRLWGDSPAPIPEDAQTRSVPRLRAWEGPMGALLDPRQLYVSVMTPVGQARVGLQTSTWGLGLLAHDGSRDQERLFGQSFGGDRVARLLFATAPLSATSSALGQRLFLAAGADVVFRDDLADFVSGDRATQGLLSLFYRDAAPHEETFAGVYAVYRSQTDRDGDTLQVWAFDAALKATRQLGQSLRVELGAEAALLTGSTTRAVPQDGSSPELQVQALGAAAELSLIHTPTDVALTLLTGYASGEASSQDDTLFRFRFDPNYKVGLVLFDSYLPAATRASWRRATDPNRSGDPPQGVEGLISEGAVENAVYLNPQLTFGTMDGMMAGVGFLWARAASPPSDAYLSLERGGRPTGVRGASPVSLQLGYEVDVAAQYRKALVSDLILEIKGEFGIFFPGAAFEDAQGNSAPPVGLARGRVALSW